MAIEIAIIFGKRSPPPRDPPPCCGMTFTATPNSPKPRMISDYAH
jgi:hypothetical protein